MTIVARRQRACLVAGATSLLLYALLPPLLPYTVSDAAAALCGEDGGTNFTRHDRAKNSSSRHHRYPEFEEEKLNQSAIAAAGLNATNRVVHKAQFGLGHRLARLGCAWHLVKSLNWTRLDPVWEDCSGTGNIFPKLFGGSYVDVPGGADRALEAHANGNAGTSIVAKNDVSGYYDGANYKWHRVPLSARKYKGEHSPWLEKLDSDAELFRMLRRRFVGKDDAVQFMEEHGFRDRFVVGLHLRLGNGEPMNFVTKGRGVADQLEFVYNMIDLIRSFLDELRVSHPERFVGDSSRGCGKRGREPLVFLATDSPRFIPVIQAEIETVFVPQRRVDEGVTFYALTAGEECLQGWRDMVLDSVLLSFADVLISPRYSSFAQVLPLQLACERGEGEPGPHFCEMSDTARSMTCVEDMRTWIFRDDESKAFEYSTLGDNATGELPVVHKLSQHLPDVVPSAEYEKAARFVSDANRPRRLRYGEPFESKYRKELVCPNCTDFTFT